MGTEQKARKGRFGKGMAKIPGSGRKKGVPNKTTSQIRNLLEHNREGLISKAIEMAQAGNTVILSKLLDKLLPSLSHNKNEVKEMTLEEFMRDMIEKTNQSRK